MSNPPLYPATIGCAVCGFKGDDLIGVPPKCPVEWRCKKTLEERSKPWVDTHAAERPNYDLTAEDHSAIAAAVLKWQTRRAEEEAEASILFNAILDDAKKDG